jgi:hypothetical protein
MREKSQRVKRVILGGGVLAALSLTACSTVKFAYNNVDWMLLRKADSYLDLRPDQRDHTAQFIEARMETHRSEELPLYVATLARVRQMLADGLTREDVDWIRESVQSHYRRFMAGTIPGLTPVLASLSEPQIDFLEKRIEEKNREYEEKRLAPTMKVYLSNRIDRNVKIVEFWTGRVRDDQVVLIEQYANAMPVTAEQWFAYRQGKQRVLLAMLRRGASSEELDDFLLGWWGDLSGLPESLRAMMKTTTRDWTRLILDLDDSLSDEQRRHLLEKLDRFVAELGSLVPESRQTSAEPDTRRPLETSLLGSGVAQ